MTARRRLYGAFLCLFAASTALFAQHPVDPRNMYERVLVVVPLVGKGTLADPKRPLYAPMPSAMNPASRTGILGFTHVMSDDGKFALVEFVARDRSAFKDILADTTLKPFIKGVHKREDVLTEFQKYKKDFSFDHFGVRMP